MKATLVLTLTVKVIMTEASHSAMALLVVCLIDTLLFGYLILRSRLHGLLLVLTVPLTLLFSPVAVVLLGKGRAPRHPEQESSGRLGISGRGRWWKIALLSVIVYPVLFFGFGYFVAWQSSDVRTFYGGTDPGNAVAFFANSFSHDPLQYPFEAIRGMLWVGLAMLVIRATKSGRWETALLVALLFALIENDQLLIPNPLMPSAVRLVHFIETASENFIFGLVASALLMWHPQETVEPVVSRAST